MKKIVLILFFLISSLFSQDEIFKELDCNKTTSEVEKIICSDEELVNHQKEIERQYNLMNNYYKEYNYYNNPDKVWDFWKTKRDECKEKDCLLKYYKRNDFFVGTIEWSMKTVDEQFDSKILNGNYSNRIYSVRKEKVIENEKLCSNLYNDLVHNFDDINIIPPIVQSVEYNDERLKKALGSCYNARMDLDKSRHPEISVGLFSLWSVDIDKDDKEELIFRRDNSWHYIDKEKCEEALKDPNFNPEKDQVSIKIDYLRSYGDTIDPPIIIEYDNKTRILNIHIDGLNPKFERFGAMVIKTFGEGLGKTFPEDFYHEGSYELFDDTCSIDFRKHKQIQN